MQNKLQNKKIAFLGTPDFTVEFLDLFEKLDLDISLIITGEDKPFGRGLQMHSPAPAVWAKNLPLTPKVLQPKKLDEEFFKILIDENNKKEFDLFIVIAYGKIIPERVINLPKFGTINLHYSLLPKYRGASPVESAILSGDTVTGITIQQMVYKLDAGDVLFQEDIEIEESETTRELREKMNKKALELFPNFLENLFEGEIMPITQDESQATKCGKFTKEEMNVTKEISEIKEGASFENLYRKFKAFDKRIYFFHYDLRVKITDMNKNEILKVLPESKKEISKKDFENAFGKIF